MIQRSVLCLLLLFSVVCLVHSQTCYFTTPLPRNPNVYWTTISDFRQCVNAVPADSDLVSNTIEVARSVVEGYSYQYLVENSTFSKSSYSLSVLLQNRLDQIKAKKYANDYEFQRDMSSLFASLYDAHTMYILPAPYRSAYVILPLEYSSTTLKNTTQVVAVKSDNLLYNAIVNRRPSNLGGKTISTINGISAMDFLNKFADIIPFSKEAASRFNEAIKTPEMSAGFFPLPDFDTLTYGFADGTTATYPMVVLLTTPIRGISDFKRLMSSTQSKLQIKISNEKRKPTMAVDPRVLFKEFQVPKILKQQERMVKRSVSDGPLQLLYKASDDSVLYYYHTTLKISIFKITSFSPNAAGSEPWDEFKRIIELGVAHAKSVSTKELILDLQGNGGGYVCLNNALLRYLIQSYSNLNELYQPFEYKKNKLVDSARQFFYEPSLYLNTTNLTPYTNDDFWKRGVTKNLGGVIASYSQYFYLDCANEGNFFFRQADHYFNKIIILTDGLCGSSCSQFASKLIFNNKALAVNVGGFQTPFETTSFNGGAVLHYDDLVKNGAPIPQLTKSNAIFTFNEFHMYLNAQQSIPREFHRLKGDVKLNTWDFDALDELVEQVAPYFKQMSPLNQ